MKITGKTKICMSIGDPIMHSVSPIMHNAGYQAIEIDNDFIYVACHVKSGELKNCIDGIRAMNIRGASCKMHHKNEVMQSYD